MAAISATITCKVDPALIARTRVAVLDGVATVEIYDPTRESWNEIFRSTVPDVISATPPPEPEQPASRLEPVPGQILVHPNGRIEVAK